MRSVENENQTDPIVHSLVAVIFIGISIFILAQPNYWAEQFAGADFAGYGELIHEVVNLAWSVPGAMVFGIAGLVLLFSSLLTRNE